jgi:DNA polymerase III epsilon subunit-like protein
MVFIIVDLETTGLPIGPRFHENLQTYNKCRVVSIAWIVLNDDLNEVDRQYYLVHPDNFIIPKDSTRIHGITTDEAIEKGIDIKLALNKMLDSMRMHGVHTIVAHNINFDINVLKSEMFRYDMHAEIDEISKMDVYCTMFYGRKLFKLSKVPKLIELYKLCTDRELEGAHHALIDTDACAECFKILKVCSD